MRIHFERSGGMAGTGLSLTLDVDALPPPDSQRLQDLVEAAGFFALPGVVTAPGSDADRFQYTLTIETPERRHTVEIHEVAAPPALRTLLEWLTAAARARRRPGPP